jgi:site-specific DNA-methyltransferase (adenine-specific)
MGEIATDSIIHADCMDVLPNIQSNFVDAYLIDPPYNISYAYNEYKDNRQWDEYFAWQLSIVKEAVRTLKPSGSVLWLNYPEPAAVFYSLICQEVQGLQPVEMITWIYHQHTGGKPLRRATRLWLWFSKGEPWIDQEALLGEYRNPNDKRIRARVDQGSSPVDYDWWFYEQVKNVSSEKINHPCQLPLAMIMRLLQMVVPPQGLVVDPFSGSGTTPVAAKKLGRHWIGIESDKTYYTESIIRLQATVEDLGVDG